MIKYIVLTVFALIGFTKLSAQESWAFNLINNKVSYSCGEEVKLNLTFNENAFSNFKGKKYRITYFEEGKDKLNTQEGIVKKKDELIRIPGANTPQIMRIKVELDAEGTKQIKHLGVAFDPEKIKTTTVMPNDFLSFWDKQLNALGKIALDPRMKLISSTDSTEVYHIDYKVDQSGSRFYGVLTLPKNAKTQKYPAIVTFPGAGVRSYPGDSRFAQKGIITLQVGVHGLPIDMPSAAYQALASGALNGYQYYNLQSKETYYFNRVIKGCVRAIDFLNTLEQFDGENIVVNGSSQGGALSLITGAIDKRVKAIAAYCPALCQTNGSAFGAATGWPKPLLRAEANKSYFQDWESVIPYYDAVNFSRYIDVPVFMTFGLIDDVTPGTTVFAAYNNVKSEKSNYIMANIAHANHYTQVHAVTNFILKFLGK